LHSPNAHVFQLCHIPIFKTLKNPKELRKHVHAHFLIRCSSTQNYSLQNSLKNNFNCRQQQLQSSH